MSSNRDQFAAFRLGAKDQASSVIKSALSSMLSAIQGFVAGVAARFEIVDKIVGSFIGFLFKSVHLFVLSTQAIINSAKIVSSVVGGVIAVVRGMFTILGALFRGILAVVRGVANAIAALVRTVTSTLSSLFGGLNSHFGRIVKWALVATGVIGAAFIATAVAAERAWLPVGQTIQRMTIAGAGGAIAGLRQFAMEVRRSTLIASSAVLTLAEQAVRLRIPENQLKAITAAAIGLSHAVGISAADAMDKLAEAVRGDTSGLFALIPQLKGVQGEAARLAIIMEVARKGMAMAQGGVSTFAGLWQSFKNVLAENAANLGEKIAPGIKLIVDALRPLLGLLESSGAAFAAIFNTVAAGLAPLLTVLVGWFAHAMAGFLAFGQTVVQNWRLTWELIVTTVEYALVVVANEARHFFANTLPALFNFFIAFTTSWARAIGDGLRYAFATLWENILAISKIGWDEYKHKFAQFFVDLAAMVAGALGDLAGQFAAWLMNPTGRQDPKKAAEEMAKRLAEELAGGGVGEKMRNAWKSITDGFKNVPLPELPMFSPRSLDAAEKSLKDRMIALARTLAKIFNIDFQKQLAGFNDIINGQAAVNVQDQMKKLSPIAGLDPGHSSNSGVLESRFLTRAPGSNPLTQMLKEQQIANQLLQQHLAAVRAATASQQALQSRVDQIKADIASVLVVGN